MEVPGQKLQEILNFLDGVDETTLEKVSGVPFLSGFHKRRFLFEHLHISNTMRFRIFEIDTQRRLKDAGVASTEGFS